MVEKVYIKFEQKKIKKIVAFLLFCGIMLQVFCGVSHLLRTLSVNRFNLAGIKSESVDLDMVYVGGSATFVYWQPLKAWNDYGLASYNYATNSILAENIKYYIKEVEKVQSPSLYVVDLRPFVYWNEEPHEGGIRNGADSMDFMSLNRWGNINTYFNNRKVPEDTDIISYYFDIATYHTNTSNLSSPIAWALVDNNSYNRNRGWAWMYEYAYLEPNNPIYFQTEERTVLDSRVEMLLRDLLEYCRKNKLEVTFVVCPYSITEKEYVLFNTIGDIVLEYGYDYLNANDYYQEMNLDFTKDFYNANHVNAYGAEKYTEFLSEYLNGKYNFADHRGDVYYASWEEAYVKFKEEEIECKETIDSIRVDVEKGLVFQKQLKETNDLNVWKTIAADSRYTLLLAQSGTLPFSDVDRYASILVSWGINNNSSNQFQIIDYSGKMDSTVEKTGTLGPWKNIEYRIEINDMSSFICVDEMEYILDENGLNVVVFDNNYRKVVDYIKITLEDGALVVSR